MNEKEILSGLLTQAYGLNEEGVASLYNEEKTELMPDALTKILDIDKTRISTFKVDEKKVREEAYGRAKREVMTDYEKQIREKYQIQSDKQGVELIDELVESYRSQGGGGDLTDDQVKKSKVFLDFVEITKREYQSQVDEKETALNQFKAEVAEKETWYAAKEAATSILEALNPILPQDASKASNLKGIYLNELRNLKRELRDGKIVLLDGEGKDLQDGHGNRIPFEAKAKEIAEKYFEFAKGSQKSSPPMGKGGSATRKFIFASEDDYFAQKNAEKDPEVLQDMRVQFLEWQKSLRG
jgi:hypothetical protein